MYVKAAATHVLNAAGGTGAFREVADSILFAQGKDAVLGTAAGYAQVMAKMAQ
ncbi:3-deoxy-D-manno-octulosonate 8-phosphate phosphatase KdsC [compost metagenome]